MNEIEIYITRHGETDANSKGVVAGFTDVDLNENGVIQAKLLASKLEKIRLIKIYSSDLKRAKQTAEIIASKQNCEIEFFSLLRERNFGEKEGTNNSDYYKSLGESPSLQAKASYTPAGAESLDDVVARIELLIKNLIAENISPILLVGHLSVNRTLLMRLLGMNAIERMSISQENCALSLIRYNLAKQKFTLEFSNDTSHLN